MAKAPKYTPEMVAAILALSQDGPITAESATKLVETDPAFAGSDITVRGVIAKVRTMNLPYQKKERTAKDGSAIATKAELAAEVAKLVGVTSLDSLQKAEKADLKRLVSALKAAGEVETADVAFG